MRTSRRRLLFNVSVTSILLFAICVVTRAQNIPGLPGNAAAAAFGAGVSENKLGSVLFFNYYVSDLNSTQINTRINITNVNPAQDIALHLFFVSGLTCSVADTEICLTRNQTTSFLVSEIDPNVSGYLVVVAVDNLGRPTGFNYLAGDESVVAPTGHKFGLAAVAAARLDATNDTGTAPATVTNYSSSINDATGTATMLFDGRQYDYLPYTMVLDNFPSQVSGSPLGDTRLYVYSPLSDLTGGGSGFSGSLFFLIYGDQEDQHSGQLPLNCYLTSDKQRISSVRTVPNLNSVVPAGHSGWASFYALGSKTIACDSTGRTTTTTNAPLMGATATKVSAFTGGHNLRYATIFPAYSITVPVIGPPNCPSVSRTARDGSLCASF